jgi:hypothetical protein
VTGFVQDDLFQDASVALFTIAEARAFDKAQLASATDYPDATISEKETEIAEFFGKVCGVNFCPTTYTDEYHDGDGTASLLLDWPLVTAITAASMRDDTTWTALTATELAQLQVFKTGEVYWDGGYWHVGRRNIKVTYTAGHAVAPELIKRAALMICVTELPSTNVPFSADSYEAGGMNVSYAEGDGYNDNWSRIADVRRAIRLYSMKMPGIA